MYLEAGAAELPKGAYVLQHLEDESYITEYRNKIDHLVCFSTREAALDFRTKLKLVEHVGIRWHTNIAAIGFTSYALNIKLEGIITTYGY